MTPTRRQVLVALGTLISTSCALKFGRSPEPDVPMGVVCGHVEGRGLRFGKVTDKNPSGRYDTYTLRPGVWVILRQWNGAEFVVVDKTFTDDQGWFEFPEMPVNPEGMFYLQAANTSMMPFTGIREGLNYQLLREYGS